MNHTFAQVDEYCNKLFASEDEILQSIEPALLAANATMPQGSISASQGRFLQLMAYLCGAKRILELGTLGGYSTIWLARALPEGGKLTTIEFERRHAAVAQEHIDRAGLSDKVDIHIGKAMDILHDLKAANTESFDMVFIDADKPPYQEYFELALSMTRKGGVIIADNVVRGGKVLEVNSVDAAVKGVQLFNEALSKNDAVHAIILQTVGIKNWDGMAIAVVK